MTLDRRSLNCTIEILMYRLAIQTADAMWRGIPDCKSSRRFSLPDTGKYLNRRSKRPRYAIVNE